MTNAQIRVNQQNFLQNMALLAVFAAECTKRRQKIIFVVGVRGEPSFFIYVLNPVKYTDPTGRTITSDDASTNDTILADINRIAGGGFYFDNDNNLQLDTNVAPTGNYSPEVRDALSSFIDGKNKDIQVSILYSDTYTSFNGEGVRADGVQNNGFTSYGDQNGTSYRVGVRLHLPNNEHGESAAIFLHEFYGHLVPTANGQTGGNAVYNSLPIINGLQLPIHAGVIDPWGIDAPTHDGALEPVDIQGWAIPR